jgi:hypothetical protein
MMEKAKLGAAWQMKAGRISLPGGRMGGRTSEAPEHGSDAVGWENLGG